MILYAWRCFFYIPVCFSCRMILGIRVLVTVGPSFCTSYQKISPKGCIVFFGIIWFLTALFIWWVVYWVLFSTLKDALTANAICHEILWHLKVSHHSALSVFLGQSGIYFLGQCNIFVSSPCWIFISSPVGFIVSPVENLLL